MYKGSNLKLRLKLMSMNVMNIMCNTKAKSLWLEFRLFTRHDEYTIHTHISFGI